MTIQYNIHKDDRASQYALSVFKEEILVSDSVYDAATRHLNDMITLNGYYWDYKESNNVIQFGEMLPNPSTGKPLKLDGFQDFILGSLVGWKTNEGNKRYRTANISMARKQGKSMLQAILALYTLIFEDNPSQHKQIQLGANSRYQSSKLFDFVKMNANAVVAKSVNLRKQLKIIQGRIEHKPSYSYIENISSEAGNLDGSNTLLFIVDEFHEAKDRKLLNVIESGMVLQPNGQTVIISTVGLNINYPYKQMFDYAKDIASGKEKNERYFSFIAYNTLEEKDRPELWAKSNPLINNPEIGKTLFENLQQDYEDAKKENEENGFIVKNLNIWTKSAQNSYLSLQDWEACKTDEDINIQGTDVYIGVDLARLGDLSALAFLHPIDSKMYVDSHVFVGKREGIKLKSERDKIDYQMLADKNYATITKLESGIISFEQIVEHMVTYIKDYNLNVKGVMYDPAMSELFLQEIEVNYEHLNLPLIEVGQGWKNLSFPIKQFKLDVFEKKIVHKSNPILDMAVMNAKVKVDNNDNLMLIKDRDREKIDSIVAMVTAYSHALHHEYDNSQDMEEYILSDDFGF